ncbi:MAG: hypothetical protein CMA56_04110 [Euryarchaeota archaeon]|nr:hypothetical protein [Euryarchaeota archaeon]
MHAPLAPWSAAVERVNGVEKEGAFPTNAHRHEPRHARDGFLRASPMLLEPVNLEGGAPQLPLRRFATTHATVRGLPHRVGGCPPHPKPLQSGSLKKVRARLMRLRFHGSQTLRSGQGWQHPRA